MKNAVFAGTFDPVTKGHEEVIKKGKVLKYLGSSAEQKYAELWASIKS